jgi:hypothetical protein
VVCLGIGLARRLRREHGQVIVDNGFDLSLGPVISAARLGRSPLSQRVTTIGRHF